jgi:hypothetical protein
MVAARPKAPILAAQAVRRASSRALDKEGSRIEINKAMIATTTSSSISVKPLLGRFEPVSRFNIMKYLLAGVGKQTGRLS